MALIALLKLNLQTRVRSHPMGLHVWFSVRPFDYFHTSCVQTAKALARLRRCAGSPEPSLVAYAISTIISWAGSIIFHDRPATCLSEKTKYWKFLKFVALQIITVHNNYKISAMLFYCYDSFNWLFYFFKIVSEIYISVKCVFPCYPNPLPINNITQYLPAFPSSISLFFTWPTSTIIWAISWENLLMPYTNKSSDQPEHPRTLISAFVVRCLVSINPLVSISKIIP